jgi:asparagine synthase (glutamine-hydrolysing)
MSQIFGLVSLGNSAIDSIWAEKMKQSLPSHESFTYDVVLEHDYFIGYQGNKETYLIPQKSMMLANSQYIICGDVQLYNHVELCNQLNMAYDENFQIRSVLKAFERYGEKCVDYFNGDFSFFVYDLKTSSFWLFRDHLGVRPLYYVHHQEYFAFASDIRSLLSLPFIDVQLEERKMFSNLTFTHHIDTQRTDFKSILKLPAAHYLLISNSNFKLSKYWNPKPKKIRFNHESDYIEKFNELIIDAVKIRIPKDKSFGSELSGGLDSSVISVIAARSKAENQELTTFSWSPDFETQPEVEQDERLLIQKICNQENITCMYYKENEDWKNYTFNTYIQAGEWVFQHYQNLMLSNTHILMTGWGGDQASSYRHTPFSLIAQGEILSFIKEIKYRSKGSWKSFLRNLHFYTWKSVFNDPFMLGKQKLIYPSILKHDFLKQWQNKVKKDIVYVPINPSKHIESGDIQTRTEYTAWLGAYFNLRVVYPLLDKRVIEFSLGIPRNMFVKNGTSRYLFRKAFESMLPEEIFNIVNKDDPARSTYSKMTLPSRIDSLVNQFNHLDRSLFEEFVDFELLEQQIKNLVETQENDLFVHLFYSLKHIAAIQKLINDSKK